MAGPVYVEDNELAKALAGLSNTFSGREGAAIASARSEIALREEQRRKLQQEIQSQQDQMDAQRAAIETERVRQMNQKGPASLQTAWATSGGPIGAEAVPAGGPVPLRGLADASQVPAADEAAARNFELQRNKDLATYNLGVRFPAQMGTVAEAVPKLQAQASVAERGVAPIGSPEWMRTQTQLEGKQPTALTLGEKAAGNWVERDAQGNIVPASGGMLDANGRDLATGRPPVPRTPGGTIVKAGEAKMGGGGMFENEGTMRAAAFQLAQKAVRGGLSPDEEQQLQVVSRYLFPWSQALVKNAQGKYELHAVQKDQPPQLLSDALGKISGGAGAPAGTAFDQGTAAPISGVTPQQTAGLPSVSTQGAPPAQGGAGYSITPAVGGGVGEAATETLRKDVTSLMQADIAKNKFFKMFNYAPDSGVLPDQKTISGAVPSFMSGAASEMLGSGMIGQRVAKTLDPKAQGYNALAYQFVEPVIRLASGAAIGPREYSQYFNMYIPNANDGPPEVKQKLDAMQIWTDAIRMSTTAGGAIDYVMKSGNPLAMQGAERIRVRATEAGTLNAPINETTAGAAAPAVSAAPAAATAAPAGGAPVGTTRTIGAQKYRKVGPDQWETVQ